MRNWTPTLKKIDRLNKRLDTLTMTPSRDRTPAERGQISELAKEKRRLKGLVLERRNAYLARLAQMGLDS